LGAGGTAPSAGPDRHHAAADTHSHDHKLPPKARSRTPGPTPMPQQQLRPTPAQTMPPPQATPSTTTITSETSPLSSPYHPARHRTPSKGARALKGSALSTDASVIVVLHTSPRGRSHHVPPSSPPVRKSPDPPTPTSFDLTSTDVVAHLPPGPPHRGRRRGCDHRHLGAGRGLGARRRPTQPS
jgi:hypothetical protein